MIRVDTRWRGQNGIGRYATEVTSRLEVEWATLDLRGHPSNPFDFLRLLGRNQSETIYSPGYNVFYGKSDQVPTIHDLIHLHRSNNRRALYAIHYASILRPIVRRSRLVFTVSETSKRAIERWIDDADVSVVNAGNGISGAFAPRARAEGTDARPYFIYVGNIRRHKNVEVILRALRRVQDCELLLVVSNVETAMARAADFGVADRVICRSGVSDDELATLYRGAVATVFPSIVEGFGLPAAESIACGTPVIFWNGCDSVAEITASSGISVSDPKDDREWAEALTKALNRRPTVAPHPVEYSWDRTARIISQTLRERQ